MISMTTRWDSGISLFRSVFSRWTEKSTIWRPPQYQGMDRSDARKKIISDLEEQGLLVETKPHKLMVPRGDRTHAVIEPCSPINGMSRWKAWPKRGLEVVASGRDRVSFPENWSHVYNQWLENIQDWCISRQLWWGHRIPAWYDEDNNIFVAHSLEEAQRLAGERKLIAGRGCARYLVFIRAMAVLHPGLARRNAGTRNLSADFGSDHGF